MFNNVVLDVFIGLIFIFLLYSLLATIVLEIIASWFNLRARMLLKAMRRMLEDDISSSKGYFRKSTLFGFIYSVKNLFYRFFVPIKDTEKFVQKFYDHPTIKYLGENRMFSKPSYLHSHNFSQTILHILRGNSYDGRTQSESNLISQELQAPTFGISNETLTHLKLLFADSKQDSYLFKKKLEDWFDETMERSTGWYKKQTQFILIIIGFSLAVSFNVDSIAISKILLKDKNAREQLVQLAISRQKVYGAMTDTLSKTTTVQKELPKSGDTLTTITETTVTAKPSDDYLDTTYKQLMNDAYLVQGILGLKGLRSSSDSADCKKLAFYYDSLISLETSGPKILKLKKLKTDLTECCYNSSESGSPYQSSELLKLAGWLLTALAISLGAPFWFDLLNRVVKLRQAGTKPSATSTYDQPGNGPLLNNPVNDINNNEIKG